MSADISTIIVNYNAGELLRRCVDSLLKCPLNIEIIVVDNASTDGSLEALLGLPRVRIIKNPVNVGFAAACNRGAREAAALYLLFLNPDSCFEPGTLASLMEAMRADARAGMAGGLLVNPDGTEQAGGRRAVPTPWRSFVRAFGLVRFSDRWPRLFFDFYLHNEPLPEQVIEVEAISGACMIVKREAMMDVGLWDEGYFLHCEDLDWCMRFRQKGWKILFVPSARVTHALGACSRNRPIFVEWHKHKGMIRFYHKFFRHQYPGVLMGLVVAGVWLRFGLLAAYYSAKRAGQALGLWQGHDLATWPRTTRPNVPVGRRDFGMADSDVQNRIGILGATSLVGSCLLPPLTEAGWQATAFSRRAVDLAGVDLAGNGVEWRRPFTSGLPSSQAPLPSAAGLLPLWVCAAPIWVLPEHFALLEAHGAQRVVALSSTSRFTKNNSSDQEEQAMARRLAEAEDQVRQWAEQRGVEWVILRPTLIYGLGQDKNISRIARFIRRFGFFPLFGQAHGLRQPIHAQDVACACLAALRAPGVANRAYNISGGETLTYRATVGRIFTALGRRPRLLTVPLWVFSLAISALRLLPPYRHWSTSMAERMNQDLVFDHAAATRDFDFQPRAFMLAADDLPP